MAIIKPTVGRVVWYFASHLDTKPCAAIVAHVHNDCLVNLAVFNESGDSSGRTSVTLRHPDHEVVEGDRCEWMPYQLGQAARTEQAEAKGGKGP